MLSGGKYLDDAGGGDAVNPVRFLDAHIHVESGLLRARDVKRRVAILLVALDAGALAGGTLAHVTSQSPPRRRHIAQSVDGLEKDGILKAHFRNPQRADDVAPFVVDRLFERTSEIWTHFGFKIIKNAMLLTV